MTLSMDELQTLCAEWQRRLRLQDWTIDLRIVRGYELDAQGQTNYVAAKQMAIIKILDPQDWDPACQGEQDHERTLVHELCHCRLAGVADTDLTGGEYLLMEQAVNALSIALVELKRETT